MTPRIAGLDGLRAVAVLLVLGAHLGLERVLPGGFGVTLFFFVSGWLITGQLCREHGRSGRIDLPRFYARRALRLLPASCCYIGIAGAAFTALGGHISLPGWLSALCYGANIADIAGVYHTDLPGVRHPFNILWSLAVEEHFYLIWPLLLTTRLGRRWPVVLALCLAALAWRGWLYHADPWVSDRIYKGSDTRLDSIAWGALAALLAGVPWYRRALRSGPVQGALLAALLASLLIRDPWFRDVPRTTLQGLALCGLVPALLARDNPARRSLEAVPCVAIGRLSYSLYLWHWLALELADAWAPRDRVLWLAIAVPLSALLALASSFAIEQPMLAWRRRAGSHAPSGLRDQPLAPMPTKGFVSRSSPKVEVSP